MIDEGMDDESDTNEQEQGPANQNHRVSDGRAGSANTAGQARGREVARRHVLFRGPLSNCLHEHVIVTKGIQSRFAKGATREQELFSVAPRSHLPD